MDTALGVHVNEPRISGRGPGKSSISTSQCAFLWHWLLKTKWLFWKESFWSRVAWIPSLSATRTTHKTTPEMSSRAMLTGTGVGRSKALITSGNNRCGKCTEVTGQTEPVQCSTQRSKLDNDSLDPGAGVSLYLSLCFSACLYPVVCLLIFLSLSFPLPPRKKSSVLFSLQIYLFLSLSFLFLPLSVAVSFFLSSTLRNRELPQPHDCVKTRAIFRQKPKLG